LAAAPHKGTLLWCTPGGLVSARITGLGVRRFHVSGYGEEEGVAHTHTRFGIGWKL